jgi:hypothetical protein
MNKAIEIKLNGGYKESNLKWDPVHVMRITDPVPNSTEYLRCGRKWNF